MILALRVRGSGQYIIVLKIATLELLKVSSSWVDPLVNLFVMTVK